MPVIDSSVTAAAALLARIETECALGRDLTVPERTAFDVAFRAGAIFALDTVSDKLKAITGD